MLTKNINFKNFHLKKISQNIKKDLKKNSIHQYALNYFIAHSNVQY